MLSNSAEDRSLLHLSVMSRSPSNTENICSFFDRGKYCRFGTRCKFLHIRSNPSSENQPWSAKQDISAEQVGEGVASLTVTTPILHNEAEQPKLCYFFSKFNRCKFGKGCRFEHISDGATPGEGSSVKHEDDVDDDVRHEEDPDDTAGAEGSNQSSSAGKPKRSQPKRICRYFKAGHCSLGIQCRFLHPHEQLDQEAKPPVKPPVRPKFSFKFKSTATGLDTQEGEELEADKKPVKSSPQRKHQPKTKSLIFLLEEVTLEDLEKCRTTEIAQLKKRFPKSEENTDEDGKVQIQFIFVPSDPDWPYDVRAVPLLLGFNKDYPKSVVDLSVLETSDIPNTLQRNISFSVYDWLEARFQSFSSQGKVEQVVRPLLKWLDRNIEEMFTTGLKQYQRELMAKAAGLEFVSASELKEKYKATQSTEEEQEEDGSSQEDEDEEEEDGEDQSGEEYEDEDEEEEDKENVNRRPALSDSVQRGTEVRFQNLQLKNSLATMIATKVSLQIQCDRCRGKTELTTPPSRDNAVSCSTCMTMLTVTFRTSMIHEFSAVVGYFDVNSCTVFDVVLPECTFMVGCLACAKEMPLEGVATGQPKDTWCRHCNAKMRIVADSIKFLRLQPSIQIVDSENLHQVESKLKRVIKDPAIQDGRPLPDDGICKHYKKSYRWFRFPCCGKAYPCDVCHDEKEDHAYTYANRMICGHCCKEQPYSSDRPCIRCNESLIKKRTSHWEGGKGCRDRIKMSKDDDKKYSNLNKTVSRKAAGLATGKKNTKLRHS